MLEPDRPTRSTVEIHARLVSAKRCDSLRLHIDAIALGRRRGDD